MLISRMLKNTYHMKLHYADDSQVDSINKLFSPHAYPTRCEPNSIRVPQMAVPAERSQEPRQSYPLVFLHLKLDMILQNTLNYLHDFRKLIQNCSRTEIYRWP